MRKVRTILISVFTVACVCVGWLWMSAPPPWDSRVSISFVGYTNDPSGERLVSFVLSNSSHVRIRSVPLCELVTEQAVVGATPFLSGPLYVEPGNAAEFAVSLPLGKHKKWRAALLLSREGSRSKIANWISQYPGIRNRLPIKWRGVPAVHVYSDWIRE